ncbi:MAG: hypothetical protein ACT4OE_08370 [Sphingosinicella sp.]
MLVVALSLLGGCGGTVSSSQAEAEDDRIDCRLAGSSGFERVCTVERDGRDITVRRPDGGFRRLIVAGVLVAAADGAEQAEARRHADGTVEVAIGGDVFLLPPGARE